MVEGSSGGIGAVQAAGGPVPFFLRAAAAHLPTDGMSQLAVERLVAEVGGGPAVLECAARAARTRSLAELVTILHSRASGSEAPVGERDPVGELEQLVEGYYSAASAGVRDAWVVLALFDTTFTREQAESVLRAGNVEEPEEALAELVTSGVVTRQETEDQLRFRMPALHRIAGCRRLAAEEEQRSAARRGLITWWRGAAHDVAKHWFGADQNDLFDRIQAEVPSLEQLVENALLPGEGEALAEIVGLLWPLWTARNNLTGALAWLEGLQMHVGEESLTAFDVQWAIGWLALAANDGDRADTALDRMRATSVRQEAKLDQLRGIRRLYALDGAGAGELLTRALQRHANDGMATDRFLDLSYLGTSAWLREDWQTAQEYCRRAMDVSEECGETWLRTYATWMSASVAWREGRTRDAFDLALDGVRAAASAGDRHSAALSLEVLAWHEAKEGRERVAARLFGVIEVLEEVTGVPVLFWNSEVAHDAAVRAVIDAIGDTEFRQLVRGARSHGIGDALSWLEDGLPPGPAGVRQEAAERSLTPRQLEIAMLIAEGMTNKQIARALMITVRAVEAHVERTFVRLGYVSRSQVAAWVARRYPMGVQPSPPATRGLELT